MDTFPTLYFTINDKTQFKIKPFSSLLNILNKMHVKAKLYLFPRPKKMYV